MKNPIEIRIIRNGNPDEGEAGMSISYAVMGEPEDAEVIMANIKKVIDEYAKEKRQGNNQGRPGQKTGEKTGATGK